MPLQLRDAPAPAPAEPAPWSLGMRRGLAQRCPACGLGPLYRGYVKQQSICSQCSENLLQYRADDAPAYFTILIIGHIVVPAVLLLEVLYHPPTSLQLMLWIPFTVALAVLALPRIKGALIGLQWALRLKS